MYKRMNVRLPALAVLFALLFSALAVNRASAEDLLPPTEPAAEQPASAESSSTGSDESDGASIVDADAASRIEPSPEDSAVDLPTEPAVEFSRAGRESGEPVMETNILEAVPEGMDVVLLDEQGEPLPMATEEAATLLYAGDPIWCPAGVAVPVSGGAGCTISYGSLLELITELETVSGTPGEITNPAMAGTIWISKSYNSSIDDLFLTDDFWLNGLTLTNMANYPLTIKGGWDGIGTGTVDLTDNSEFVGDSLSITNWNANVTISGITVTGANSNPNLFAAGLLVQTTKNVLLDRVISENNSAFLGEASGATLMTTGFVVGTGTVTVKNSQFNGNEGHGLLVVSGGGITMTGVSAAGNGSDGANLNNSLAVSPMNVTLNGLSVFTANGDEGLEVLSHGSITIQHVVAISNGGSGVLLDNYDSGGATSAKPITITGSGQFKLNTGHGLDIHATGAVTLSNMTASYNASDGVHVANSFLGTGAAPVTIKGVNVFNSNGGELGLTVFSDGAISLYSTTANNNDGGGVWLENDTPILGSPGVYIYGFLQAIDNVMEGLHIWSAGPVSAANLLTNNNGKEGTYIDNDDASTPMAVVLTGANVFTDNALEGLQIISKGAVTISNVTGLNNGYFDDVPGVDINNAFLPAIQQNVTFTGTNVFNNNSYYGLKIISYGAVSLSNITANNNGFGAGQPSVGGGLAVENTGAVTLPKAVTLSGKNTFNGNALEGFYIYATGAVNLSSLTATENGLQGAYIANNATQDFGHPVVISGVNLFSDNGDHGLDVISKGTITISSLTSTHNSGVGVLLDNSSPPAGLSPGIKILGYLTANENANDGLQIDSQGAVSIANLTASGNDASGAEINNSGAFTRAVMLTGINVFESNSGTGLFVGSKGAITLSRVTANGNLGTRGVLLYNASPLSGTSPGITLIGYLIANDNDGDGLQIDSQGAVLTANLSASHNGGQGVDIDNNGSYVRSVTLTGANVFTYNDANGLEIQSRGAITISNLTAILNGRYIDFDGVVLNNRISAGTQSNVTLTGTSIISHNGRHGLWITSYGAVTLNNVTADYNGGAVINSVGMGLYILNDSGALPRPVLLNGTNSFSFNDGHGLFIQSHGAVTAWRLTASFNKGIGAAISNPGPLQSKVTIGGYGLFEWNQSAGLAVMSSGPIASSNLTANYNLGSGADLATMGITGPQSVTLSGLNTFIYNGDGGTESGLVVNTDGNITVSNLTAHYNYNLGADLDNFTNWDYPLVNFATFGSVTLSGFGSFTGNGGGGLFVNTHGNVLLTRVAADLNGWGLSTGDGIRIWADGNVMLVCSSTWGNFDDGLNTKNATGVGGVNMLTLIGFYTYGNAGDDEDLGYAGILRPACP